MEHPENYNDPWANGFAGQEFLAQQQAQRRARAQMRPSHYGHAVARQPQNMYGGIIPYRTPQQSGIGDHAQQYPAFPHQQNLIPNAYGGFPSYPETIHQPQQTGYDGSRHTLQPPTTIHNKPHEQYLHPHDFSDEQPTAVLHYKNLWHHPHSSGSGTPVGSVRPSSSATSVGSGQQIPDKSPSLVPTGFTNHPITDFQLQPQNGPDEPNNQQVISSTHIGIGAQYLEDAITAKLMPSANEQLDQTTGSDTHSCGFVEEYEPSLMTTFTDEPDVADASPQTSTGPVRAQPRKQQQQQRHKAKYTAEEKLDIAITRKIGACTRCRVHKWKCERDPDDPEGMCKNCAKMKDPTLISCLRFKFELPGVRLYAIGDAPLRDWTKRWSVMQIEDLPESDWAGENIITLKIAQGVADTAYNVQLRRFNPRDGDAKERSWTANGKQVSWATEPYALANMEETVGVIKGFIAGTRHVAIEYELQDKDPLFKQTYSKMLSQALVVDDPIQKRILNDCLLLWVAMRMESRSDHIVGGEQVGLQPVPHEGTNKGKVLLSPVLSAQLNIIMASRILPDLKKRVLEGLQALMKSSRKPNWYTVYLCSFVLLHSCSLFTEWERQWAVKSGCETTYRHGDLVSEMHQGAKMLLSYYHSFSRGKQPFLMKTTPKEWRDLADLDEGQLAFVKWTAQEVARRQDHIRHIRSELLYADDYYFVSHLFDETWSYIDTFFYF